MSSKRASVGGAKAAPAAKRSRLDRAERAAVDHIERAIVESEGAPEEVRRMLAGCMRTGLEVPKDVRHPFAERALDMVAELLQTEQRRVQEKVTALERKVGESDKERETREAAAQAAKGESAAKTEALADLKAQAGLARDAQTAAKAALKAATEAQAAGECAVVDAAERRAKLEHLSGEVFPKFKEGKVPPKELKAFSKTVASLGFDINLARAAEQTFAKAAEDRGTFDGLVITELTAAFEKSLAEAKTLIDSGEASKAAHAEKVAACEAELERTTEARAAAEALAAEAAGAAQEAAAATRAADAALKDFGPEMKRAASELAVGSKGLKHLRDTLNEFFALREKTTPPPPEPSKPAEEAPAAAAEAAAEAAAAEEPAQEPAPASG